MSGPMSDSATITYSYMSVEVYENSEKFIQAVCNNTRKVPGTIMLHAVQSIQWFCFSQTEYGLDSQHSLLL